MGIPDWFEAIQSSYVKQHRLFLVHLTCDRPVGKRTIRSATATYRQLLSKSACIKGNNLALLNEMGEIFSTSQSPVELRQYEDSNARSREIILSLLFALSTRRTDYVNWTTSTSASTTTDTLRCDGINISSARLRAITPDSRIRKHSCASDTEWFGWTISGDGSRIDTEETDEIHDSYRWWKRLRYVSSN